MTKVNSKDKIPKVRLQDCIFGAWVHKQAFLKKFAVILLEWGIGPHLGEGETATRGCGQLVFPDKLPPVWWENRVFYKDFI